MAKISRYDLAGLSNMGGMGGPPPPKFFLSLNYLMVQSYLILAPLICFLVPH